jgi:hypothetical protein
MVVDKFGRHLEEHRVASNLIDWLQRNVPNYKDMCVPPYSATLNGVPWPYVKHDQLLDDDDIILLTIEPRDPASSFAILTLVLAGYSYYISSNLPQGYQDSTEPGKSIYSANAKTNSVKQGGVIREVAGNVPIYPDLICPPRRVYESHEEYLYLNLCLGAGYIDLSPQYLFIDQTPIASYSGDYDLQISLPGADISGHDAYQNWYQTSEVSDLELLKSGAPNTSAGTWTVTIYEDTGEWYMIASLDGVEVAFPFAVDAIFEMWSGTNEGYYLVVGITGASDEIAQIVEQERVETSEADEYGTKVPSTIVAVTDDFTNWHVSVSSSPTVNWEGPFDILPVNETTDTIEFDVYFPNGLVHLSSGSALSHTVEIEVQWREAGTLTWTTVSSTSFTDNTLDARGYTITVDLGSALHPELRARRVTDDATSTDYIDKVQIRRVRSLLASPTTYDDVTTIQLKFRGTNALAQSAENKINVRGARRRLPTLSNLQGYIESADPLIFSPTNSIMRFAAWQIWQTGRENNLNWDVLSTLDTLLESRGDELNADFSDETTLWEALKIMLAPGYCEPTVKEGLLTPVRSAATTDYNFLYSPDVMLGNGVERSDTHYNASESQGVIVEYIDATSGNNETINCFLPGDSEAKAKRIQAVGITSRTKAWRYGMRARRREAFKPATITFSTEMDALNSDYGNAEGLVSPLNANQSFFVTDVASEIITLDGAPIFGTGTYYAVFRKPTGHFSGLYTIAATATDNEIELISPTSLDFTAILDDSMEPTICAIGLASELIERIWIRSIDPSGTDTVKVTAEEYIAEIFADDNNAPS